MEGFSSRSIQIRLFLFWYRNHERVIFAYLLFVNFFIGGPTTKKLKLFCRRLCRRRWRLRRWLLLSTGGGGTLSPDGGLCRSGFLLKLLLGGLVHQGQQVSASFLFGGTAAPLSAARCRRRCFIAALYFHLGILIYRKCSKIRPLG
jgi:hypothetical protein